MVSRPAVTDDGRCWKVSFPAATYLMAGAARAIATKILEHLTGH